MRYMVVVYFVTWGVFVFGLLSVQAESDHVVTHVGHNAVISLNVSQAGGEFKVGMEVNNVTEYLFLKFNDTGITRLNTSRAWYRDRYRVRGSIASSVFRLTLYNVTTEDAGIYECREMDINQRVPGCEQLLIVAKKPSQPNITGPASAVSGGSVTLTCSSSFSRSLPPDHPPLKMTYTWRRNSEEIHGGEDVPVDGPNLTMRHISREKDGNYTCQAVEEGLESDWSHGHVLDVQYGPYTVEFNETDDTVAATEGDPLTVRCSADCNPACTVTWWDTSRQRMTSGQREAVLSIPAVNRSLSDLYTCHANNTHGNKSRNLKLDKQSAEPGVSNVVSTAAVCSVLVVLVAVVLAILLYRHKAKKGKRPYRVGADKEDQHHQDPSHLYSKVNKRRRAGREVSDVYEPVKLDSPRQFMNRMYGPRPSSERMVLINNSDDTPGVTNCGKRNEDGLIYADLDLAQPTLVDGMPIIHSREEPVVYEEIDFFLTPGPQLPDKIWEVEEDDDCW